MITVPIGLNEDIVAKIDSLVKKGIYKNRTEALRDQIVKGLAIIELIDDDFSDSDLFHDLLNKMSKWKKPPNLLPTKKTITELVSEGRER